MRQVGWKIVPCVIPYDFCRMKSDGVRLSWMELNGTRSDSYDVISSLLEKDIIIRAHFFKIKKPWVYEQSLNYNDTKELI